MLLHHDGSWGPGAIHTFYIEVHGCPPEAPKLQNNMRSSQKPLEKTIIYHFCARGGEAANERGEATGRPRGEACSTNDLYLE